MWRQPKNKIKLKSWNWPNCNLQTELAAKWSMELATVLRSFSVVGELVKIWSQDLMVDADPVMDLSALIVSQLHLHTNSHLLLTKASPRTSKGTTVTSINQLCRRRLPYPSSKSVCRLNWQNTTLTVLLATFQHLQRCLIFNKLIKVTSWRWWSWSYSGRHMLHGSVLTRESKLEDCTSCASKLWELTLTRELISQLGSWS